MSASEQRRQINRSRKASAFFFETGKAGTVEIYTDCPGKIQTERHARQVNPPRLVLYKLRALRYSPLSHGII
jgi:hypothetical protein